jgi:hypothetical protein
VDQIEPLPSAAQQSSEIGRDARELKTEHIRRNFTYIESWNCVQRRPGAYSPLIACERRRIATIHGDAHGCGISMTIWISEELHRYFENSLEFYFGVGKLEGNPLWGAARKRRMRDSVRSPSDDLGLHFPQVLHANHRRVRGEGRGGGFEPLKRGIAILDGEIVESPRRLHQFGH